MRGMLGLWRGSAVVMGTCWRVLGGVWERGWIGQWWRRACVKSCGVAWPCARVQAHWCARASLQSGGALYVTGASSVTVTGGSTIINSTAQEVRRSVAVRVSCVCLFCLRAL